MLQAVNLYLSLSPKQIDVLYNFQLILGQKQLQQAPLQIAAGSQFVPKTNGCTIQLPINPGTKAAAAGPFTDCCRLSICPQNKWTYYTAPNYSWDKSSRSRPPLQIAVGSQFVPKTNGCTIQLQIIPGTNPAAAHPFMVLQPSVRLIPGTTSLKAPEKKALVVRVHSAYFEVDQLNVSLATPLC